MPEKKPSVGSVRAHDSRLCRRDRGKGVYLLTHTNDLCAVGKSVPRLAGTMTTRKWYKVVPIAHGLSLSSLRSFPRKGRSLSSL